MKKCKGSAQWEKTCFAVDIQEDKLVIVRAERCAWLSGKSVGRPHGRVKTSTVSSDDPSFTEEVQKGASVIGCLSTSESLTCWLEAPYSSFRKARKVFPTILDIQLPFALEDCVCIFFDFTRPAERPPPSAKKARTRALAVAARLVDVEKKIDSFKSLGMDPLVLDQEGIALWTQSLLEMPDSPNEGQTTRVVVCLTWVHATVVIGRAGEFLSAHKIRSYDTARISRLLRARLETEVGHAPSGMKWFWTGPAAEDSGIVKEMQGRLAVDWPGPSRVHDEPKTFLARALATRALLPGPLRCNVRTGPLTHPEIHRRIRRNSVKAALIYLLSGLLLCSVNWTLQKLAAKKEADMEHALTSLAENLVGYDIGGAKGRHTLKLVDAKIEERKTLLQPFVTAFSSSLIGTMSAIMETGKKYDLRYAMLSLSREHVLISGTAGDWNSCEKLSATLKKVGFSILLNREEVLVNERIPFTITMGTDRHE